jgi:hypothetical protein
VSYIDSIIKAVEHPRVKSHYCFLYHWRKEGKRFAVNENKIIVSQTPELKSAAHRGVKRVAYLKRQTPATANRVQKPGRSKGMNVTFKTFCFEIRNELIDPVTATRIFNGMMN